ncbi:MAG: T9SS type A sorting domain-containing protein, partial [Cyclobacteriaceae bacterium]
VNLTDNNGNPLSDADVTGMMRYTGTIEGLADNVAAPANVTFTSTGTPGEYVYTSGPIALAGVYNISLDARKGTYARSLVHSIGVTDRKAAPASQVSAEAFPNPFNEQVRVRFDMATDGDVTFMVRDITGKEVYSQEMGRTSNGAFEWRPSANQPEGLYLYEIQSGSQTINGKIILSR